MLKNFVVTLLIVIMTISLAIPCVAADIVSYDAENLKITVSGEANVSGQKLMIRVSKADQDISALSDSNLPLIFKQITAGSNKSFTQTLTIPDNTPGGKYAVYVLGDSLALSDGFIYINAAAAQSVVDALKHAIANDDITEFRNIIANSAGELGIDTDDDTYKNEMDEAAPMLFKSDFDNALEFNGAYQKMCIYAAIMGASSADVLSILQTKGTTLDSEFDFNRDYTADTSISSDAKAEFLGILSNINYADEFENGEIDFDRIISESKPLAAIRVATVSGIASQIKKIMETDFASKFTSLYSYSNYKSLNDKDSVYGKMMSKTYASFDDIAANFKKSADEALTDQNKGSGNDNLGGIVGGSISTPPSTVDKQDKGEVSDKPVAVTIPGSNASFSDVPADSWYSKPVTYLVSTGVINGYEDGTYKPDNRITRAEYTKLVVELYKKNSDVSANSSAESDFSDVDKNAWYYDCVSEGAALGLIQGNDGRFNPDSQITRQDAALILYRLLDKMGNTPKGMLAFDDRSDISKYARSEVAALAAEGIVSGMGNGRFMPLNNITRAETAQMLYNAFGK